MKTHEIKFEKSINKRYIKPKMKALLMAMGEQLPAIVKIITPNKVESIKVT